MIDFWRAAFSSPPKSRLRHNFETVILILVLFSPIWMFLAGVLFGLYLNQR